MEAQGETLIGDYKIRMKELKEFDESKMGVKGLSESGITSIPTIFVHPEESFFDFETKYSISTPVIDFSEERIVDQVKEAAKKWGFFQVVNHGIPICEMENVLSSVKAFHDMPFEAKSKYHRATNPSSSVGRSLGGVSYVNNLDLVESGIGVWSDTLRVLSTPDPPAEEEIPEICRREVREWLSLSVGVAERALELLAKGLGIATGRFRDLEFCGSKNFVGHCYPPCPEANRTFGLVSHTDNGTITVLMQNHVQGLQVKHDDSWVDVKPLRGSLIIILGEFFEITSNGVYKSVEHRVLANSSKESRISIVMLFGIKNWKDDCYYGPLPELISPENPPKYRNFTEQEFRKTVTTPIVGVNAILELFKI